jgi:hypothetical protein
MQRQNYTIPLGCFSVKLPTKMTLTSPTSSLSTWFIFNSSHFQPNSQAQEHVCHPHLVVIMEGIEICIFNDKFSSLQQLCRSIVDKGISTGPTQTTTPCPSASVRTEHTAQRGDQNRKSCPKASMCTHSGLRFGPKMHRPG